MSAYEVSRDPYAVAAATVASQPAPPLAGDNPASPNPAPGEAAAGRAIFHRGYEMVRTDEHDGDGFSTPAYIAWRDNGSIRGESIYLSHPRFGFEPTAEWFCCEVDDALAGVE